MNDYTTIPLRDFHPVVGIRLRWAEKMPARPRCPAHLFVTPHMWEVKSLQEGGCVIEAVPGQGISPHRHLMAWDALVAVDTAGKGAE